METPVCVSIAATITTVTLAIKKQEWGSAFELP